MDTQSLVPQQLIDALGIEALPQEMQDDIIGQLGESILRKSAIAILERLPEQDREQYGQLIDSEDLEKIAAFLKERVPDTDSLVQSIAEQEVARLKATIAQLAQ